MSEKPVLAARLRHASKAAHHRLDHHPLLAVLLDAGIDIKRYGDALAALQGVFSAAENLVARQGGADFPHFPHTPRTPALNADLADLGRIPIPFAGCLPSPDPAGARIGLLYVLEGSALGGQVLARKLRSALGPECPLRFLAGAGEAAAASRWAAFWQYAANNCDPADFPAAEEAAIGLFSAFYLHLDFGLSQMQKNTQTVSR